MLYNNNLIVIYGKPATNKSSLGVSLLNSSNKNACYLNIEGNNHLDINDNIKVIRDNINSDLVIKCLQEYDVVLIDYLELLDINKEQLMKLKEIAKDNNNKTLITISCCSSSDDLLNNHYEDFKSISDLLITVDKKNQ